MGKLNDFNLDEYLSMVKGINLSETSIVKIDSEAKFNSICKDVKDYFNKEWELEYGKNNNSELLLERQKKAIIGHVSEVNYFKSKISEYLKLNNLLDEWYPKCYIDLTDAIFHDVWGLAGLSNWMYLQDSSSAKIIGDRIYYLINGQQELQPQRISNERFQKLKKALLLKTPKKRLNENYLEVYMITGERIAIYTGDITKEGQASMVFRRYTVKDYTFNMQEKKGTIPKGSAKFFEAFSQVGYNVAFLGPVRTGKTTFLTTWQSYEDPTLEGVMVETDPEIPMHLILPEAPIMQLIADGDELIKITKSILRSDADYIVVAEARDAYALHLAIKVANKGTRRCKLTYHITEAEDFIYEAANELMSISGGNLDYTIAKVAKSYHYLFQFSQLEDKSKKRLTGIFEVRYDKKKHEISIHQICKYEPLSDSWTFKYDIGEDKERIAIEENTEAFNVFKEELLKLSKLYPMEEDNVFVPLYGRLGA